MPRKRKAKNTTKSRDATKRVRNKAGVFVSADGTSKFDRWNEPSALGFARWFRDVQPRVLHSDNTYKRIRLTKEQGSLFKRVLAADPAGKRFKHQMAVLVAPRRHSKSTLFALIVLWLTSSRKHHTVQLLGSNLFHSTKTQFQLCRNIIENTPKLRLLFSPLEKNLLNSELKCSKNKSTIQMLSGTSTASSFGMKIDCLWVSDLHSAVDLQPWYNLQASLLDSDGLILADGNPDHIGGPLHLLEQESSADKSIYYHHVSYADFDEYKAKAPRWIDRAKAERLERTLLEVDFRRDILGLRSSTVNALFPEDVIQICRDTYRCPVDDLKAFFGERSFVVGGGLDRADSEWGSVFGNDNTIFTTIAKVADPENQEPLIYVLNQHLFRPSTGSAIKKHILAMHKKYGFKNITLEAHSTQDIFHYLLEQGLPVENVSPHSTTQNAAWPDLVRLARTGCLRISNDLPDLFQEMAGMTYTKLGGTGKYAFGSGDQRQHDDRCFSLLWAVYSLRNEVLQLYTLDAVQCLNRSSRRQHCFIFNGGLELACGEQCHAYQQCREMYLSYMAYQTESTLTLPEFYKAFVTVKGPVIYQAA